MATSNFGFSSGLVRLSRPLLASPGPRTRGVLLAWFATGVWPRRSHKQQLNLHEPDVVQVTRMRKKALRKSSRRAETLTLGLISRNSFRPAFVHVFHHLVYRLPYRHPPDHCALCLGQFFYCRIPIIRTYGLVVDILSLMVMVVYISGCGKGQAITTNPLSVPHGAPSGDMTS